MIFISILTTLELKLVNQYIVKKTLLKTIKVSFQEKTSKGFVDRSFDTPKETVGTNGVGALHLDFHLSTLRKMPDMIRGVVVTAKQS